MSAEVPIVIAATQGKRTSLCWDFSWTFVGNAIYAGGQFATLMLLAKLLRPELVGQYALGLAVVYPVMMFTNLQLRAVLSSGSRQEIHFGNYLSLRLLTTSLAFLIVFGTTRFLGYSRALTAVVLMVGLAYAIETVSDVYYARLQLHERMAEISKSMMARALLSVLGLAVATYFTRSVLWGIAAIVLARVIILFSYDTSLQTHGLSGRASWFSRSNELALRFDLRAVRKLVWVSLPLGIVVLLVCLNSSIPNFFIKHALGEREVGIFAAIGFMVSIGNMAVVSLGQSAFTRLARLWAAGERAAFNSLLSKLVFCGAAIGVGGMLLSKLAGREILTLLFHPEYGEAAIFLPWMMAAGGVLFMAQFLGFGMTAANLYHSQVALNIVANVSLLAACYCLVQRHGLQGAILAMLIGATIQLAGSVIVLMITTRKHSNLSAKEVEPSDVLSKITFPAENSQAINGGD